MLATFIQIGTFLLSAAGLFFLIKYVGYTKRIAEESINQSEAAFKPAIIVYRAGSMGTAPKLRNIGVGPALDVEWKILGTNYSGKFDFVLAGDTTFSLPVTGGIRPLVDGALKLGQEKGVIKCNYRSISGRSYESLTTFELEMERYSTAFSDLESRN
jgi:hypothetical protein